LGMISPSRMRCRLLRSVLMPLFHYKPIRITFFETLPLQYLPTQIWAFQLAWQINSYSSLGLLVYRPRGLNQD
jgi:hypothetical protein